MAEQPKKRVDYTQVRVIGDDQAEKTRKLVEELERMILRCKREYDLWFYGTNPKPPYELRSKLDRHIRILRNKLPKRTADAFKIGVILQKYQTFQDLWDKSQRKQEEGGVAPWMASSHANPLHDLDEANEQRQEESRQKVKSTYLARVSSPDGDEDEMRKVFNSYVAAKKRVGEEVSSANFDRFRQALSKQTRQIIDSGKGKAVAYRVEIQDGRVSIKAKPED